MKNIINDYCRNENIKNGLILLDMPTGSGKTHSVLDFIYDYIISGGENRIFFVTTLLKNLPEAELRQRFEKSGKLALFKEKFLRIESNADSVCHFFASEDKEVIKHKDMIPFEILQSDEFKRVKEDALWINQRINSKNPEDRKYAARIKSDMQQHSERDFRFYLEKKVAEKFKTIKQRQDAILSDDDWKWIADMYPAVLTKNKQIIFLSINKFLARNNTIIESGYLFYDNDIINDSYIFIDEFDATKDTMLGVIIENGIRGKQDTLELFRDIYNALNSDMRTFPTALTKESEYNKKYRCDRGSEIRTPEKIIESFQEIAKNLFNEYRFDLSFKTEQTRDDSQHRFLFHDHKFNSITGETARIKKSDEDRLNYIQFGGKTEDYEKNNLSVMLGRIRGFLTYFQNGVKILALNYQNYKRENKAPNEDEFTYEFAIKSILHEFNLKDRQIDYLTSSILETSKKAINISPYDLSLYEKGFRLYDFMDDSEHDMQSIIMMENFQLTPEKILLRICEKAKVIGISATATIPSVIGNYNLDYLRLHLGDNFHNMDEEQRQALKEQFVTATSQYNQVDIIAKPVCAEVDGEYSVKSWKQIIDNDELAEDFYQTVARKTSSDKNNYNAKRYLKIALAYHYFVTNEDIYSFLCVLNKYPRKNDFALDLNVIFEICDKVERYYIGTGSRNRIELLTGDDFESEKNRISQRLACGEKIFVISIYQAIGSGQNLQYKIPAVIKGKLKKINEFEAREEKDFDAIYLDNPTNLLVNLSNDISEEDFAKYLFQVEFLREGVEISEKTAISHIRRAFQTWSSHSPSKNYAENLYDKKSVQLLSTRIIIQAIGRICRTNMKSKTIHVLVDSEILSKLDKYYFDNRLCNLEFRKLLDIVSETEIINNDADIQYLREKNNLNAERANTYIQNLLKNDWTSEKIRQWEILRQFVLEHPTIDKEQIINDCDGANIVEYMYAQMPDKRNRFYYNQNDDFFKVDVVFERDSTHNQEVSEQSARLDILMEVDDIRRLFEKKGYATSFQKNEYILSPTLFNNIYKGALGEAIGCLTIKNQTGYVLESITDEVIYECFDFKLKDRPVYFDMKHWQENIDFDRTAMYEKIKVKLLHCKGKIAVIVNMLSEGDCDEFQQHNIGDMTIIEIPFLYKVPTMQRNYEALRKLKEVIDGISD